MTPEAICNSNLLHFVITLLCRICNVKYLLKIQQNWLVTLCNKIITPIFLAPYLPRLYLYFYKFYGHHTWQADELRCDHVTNKNDIFPFTWGLWLLNLTRSYLLIKGCHPMSSNLLITRSHDKKSFISISKSPVVTELDRMVAYDNPQTARSRVLSITWSRYISTYVMHNLTGWWFLILDHHAQSHMILWSCDHMCSLMTKNVMSPIPPVLWAPNLTEWWLMTWGYTHKITPPLVKCFVLSYIFFYPAMFL